MPARQALGGDEAARMVADSVQLAAARLGNLADEEEHRRRNPLYWIDRALRALLGIPAYIVSLLVPGLSFREIDSSAAGVPLRLLSVASQALGIYWIGHAAGWW